MKNVKPLLKRTPEEFEEYMRGFNDAWSPDAEPREKGEHYLKGFHDGTQQYEDEYPEDFS